MAVINGINIDSVSFDIFDKTKLQTDARAAAFKDAKAKAEDFAASAGLSVGRVLTIDDSSTVESAPIEVASPLAVRAFAADSSAKTAVPVGEQDVTYYTTITFQLR